MVLPGEGMKKMLIPMEMKRDSLTRGGTLGGGESVGRSQFMYEEIGAGGS